MLIRNILLFETLFPHVLRNCLIKYYYALFETLLVPFFFKQYHDRRSKNVYLLEKSTVI